SVMRFGLLCVLLVGSGCGSCKKQEPPRISADPVTDADGADQKPTVIGTCFEPSAIVRRELGSSWSLLDDDPLTPLPSRHRDDRDTGPVAYFGSRAFEVAGNVVTAKEGGAIVWSTTIDDPMGKEPALEISPAGRIVGLRRWPLRSILLDEKSGHVLGAADDLAYAPDDAYAIEVPTLGDATSSVDGTANASIVV